MGVMMSVSLNPPKDLDFSRFPFKNFEEKIQIFLPSVISGTAGL